VTESESNPTDLACERHEGPTPAGGVASIAFYLNDQGNLCPKSRATRMEVHELDAEGQRVRRMFRLREVSRRA
jgi:hypothetical protein